MDVTCLPRRVLFIDDDPIVLNTLAYLLRKAGHDVEEAESGSVGLARFREKPADIVLTDFTMTGLTGGGRGPGREGPRSSGTGGVCDRGCSRY